MSLSEIEAQLSAVQQRATKEISAAKSLDELDKVRVQYLGKKGDLPKVLGGMGKLSAEDRPKIGKLANEAKTSLQSQIEQSKQDLQSAQIRAQLEAETLDVSMPGVYQDQGRIHPINSIIDQITDIFVGLGYTVAQSQEIES
ncbi:MAG: phenylalanine--tRNA ligase subunit alpha, partial [Cyanobacteria bacterium J06598_3]